MERSFVDFSFSSSTENAFPNLVHEKQISLALQKSFAVCNVFSTRKCHTILQKDNLLQFFRGKHMHKGVRIKQSQGATQHNTIVPAM